MLSSVFRGGRHASRHLKGVRHITGRLDEHSARMCAIAGYTASGNLSQLGKVWEQLPKEEHACGMEIILQNTLYNGLPSTIMALTSVAEIGIKDRIIVEQDQPTTMDDRKKFTVLGNETVKQLYGYKHKVFQQRCRLLHPAYGRWVTEFMHGRVRSRPGPSQKVRALCELAAIGGQFVLPQFQGGLMTALTVGATLEEVRGILDTVVNVWGPEQQAMIDSLWSDVMLRRLAAGGWDSARAISEGRSGAEETMHPKSSLKKDWSHLKKLEDLEPPTWRHPIITSLRHVMGLSDRTRLFALAASHTAAGNLSGLTQDWTYLDPKDHRPALEVLLGTVATSGFHRLHNALRALSDQGIYGQAIDPEREDTIDGSKFGVTGETMMQLMYRSDYPRYRDSIKKLHPDLWAWILEFYYGQVIGRACPGLTVADRQLSALGCIPGVATSQLGTLISGALNCGASEQVVRGILDQNAVVWGRLSQSYVDAYWLSYSRKLARQKAQQQASASAWR